ncbi:DUF6233 domain-containing protein [Streptomyces bacillaris]|uniref:DUF6233 domain-containing protein n=1 Tax=Streptomyces bacillaris TaxID=68179 RepID=UPI00366A53AD
MFRRGESTEIGDKARQGFECGHVSLQTRKPPSRLAQGRWLLVGAVGGETDQNRGCCDSCDVIGRAVISGYVEEDLELEELAAADGPRVRAALPDGQQVYAVVRRRRHEPGDSGWWYLLEIPLWGAAHLVLHRGDCAAAHGPAGPATTNQARAAVAAGRTTRCPICSPPIP